ncbi:MAG: lipopolysaccharide assembly protein LapA domain-containing protein [Thermomicrobiales bacterium]
MSEQENPDQTRSARETAAVVTTQTTPAPSGYRATAQKAQETALNAYRVARMVLLVLIGFVLALFVFRNWEDVPFDYVFGSASLPLAVVMLLFTGLGLVLGMLLYWFLARRTPR